jgi:beta-glucosidase
VTEELRERRTPEGLPQAAAPAGGSIDTGTRKGPAEAELRSRVDALSLEQKVRLLTGADFWSLYPEPASGLRRVVVSDGPAGVRGELWDERDTSANVPSPTALAASWDEHRVERLGRLLAAECRRKGVDVLLAPTVNLHRSPYGGRHFECFSEDPLLTAEIGAAYVRGLQLQGVGATVKHFVANDSETERYTADMRVDERTLRELYLLPFEVIVRQAGVWAVMAAYNSVNGSTMTESPLLRQILHQEWGFDGVTMSDWYAGRSTSAAASSGLDLIMPGPHGPWGAELVAAVRDGRVSEEVIDDKVLRILRLAGRVGALDGVPAATPTAAPWSEDDVRLELRGAAAAGFVLVRNSPVSTGGGAPVLPLHPEVLGRVAVLGPNAAHGRTLGGGSALVFPPYVVSPLDGLRTALEPSVRVDFARGVRAHTRLPAADVALLRLPGGTDAGVEVRFLDADGSVLGTEQRRATTFNWLGAVGDVPTERVAAVEVRARLRAPEAGTYAVGASGLGRFRLQLDDAEAFDTELTLPAGADPVEGLMAPPQHGHPVDLEEGQEVDLVLSHRPAASDSSFDAQVIAFQLNVDPPYQGDDIELRRAVALAAAAEVAVVVVGTTQEVESEGFDRHALALPGRQDELVRRVAAANPRTVVVVNAGAPVLLPWRQDVPAILLAWFPGQEFGHALADVLLGLAEPGGRLPTTWPATEDATLPSARPVDGVVAYEETLHIGYRRFLRDGVEPAYWFGHGLGYTSWEYGSVTVAGVEPDGDLGVNVVLRNSGGRPGREVVQVYLARPDSSVERPVRWLGGHAAVAAGPGEEVDVEIAVPRRRFAHWDVAAGGWTLEQGRFEIHVGSSVADLPLSTSVSFG